MWHLALIRLRSYPKAVHAFSPSPSRRRRRRARQLSVFRSLFCFYAKIHTSHSHTFASFLSSINVEGTRRISKFACVALSLKLISSLSWGKIYKSNNLSLTTIGERGSAKNSPDVEKKTSKNPKMLINYRISEPKLPMNWKILPWHYVRQLFRQRH